MNVSKLLVVDKSVFHALYQCDDKLCAFFKKYNVVLPYALAAECLISENQDLSKNPEKLLRGLDKAIKAGANIGYSSFKLFQLEKTTLCPVKSVVDESSTQQFRDGDPNTDIDFLKQEAECCRKAFEPTIKVLLGIAEKLYANPCKYSELANKSFKDNDRTYRFKNWIKFADQQTEYLLKKELSEEISSLADANWFTWQISRLWLAYCRDWSWKKSRDNSIEKIRSNDLYDIEHITYLSRADGLLTNDQKLQIPLTKAAFPRKDLFVVDTRVNDSRKVQHVFDDIVSKIPANYRIE